MIKNCAIKTMVNQVEYHPGYTEKAKKIVSQMAPEEKVNLMSGEISLKLLIEEMGKGLVVIGIRLKVSLFNRQTNGIDAII